MEELPASVKNSTGDLWGVCPQDGHLGAGQEGCCTAEHRVSMPTLEADWTGSNPGHTTHPPLSVPGVPFWKLGTNTAPALVKRVQGLNE